MNNTKEAENKGANQKKKTQPKAQQKNQQKNQPKRRKSNNNQNKNQNRTQNRTEKFDFNDILIEPAKQTKIVSRKEINPRYGAPQGSFGHLPLIAAPMDTVVSEKNVGSFLGNGINLCMPRGEYIDSRGFQYAGARMAFNSYSLIEFTNKFIKKKDDEHPSHVLIDIANGHMSDLVYVTKRAKKLYGRSMQLMVGNVANPQTYKLLSEAGADYIRIGIGNGNGCLTTEQTGIGYPMASLVRECYNIKKNLPQNKRAKIVADGGMKKYADIIKALALGADYVMVGSIFNKALQSAGQNYWRGIPIGRRMAEWMYEKGFKIRKKFRGMSTKEVQKKWGNDEIKTSEGVVRYRNVEYTMYQWKENFEHYLKSAMSYTDKTEVEEFIGKVNFNRISHQSYMRYNK